MTEIKIILFDEDEKDDDIIKIKMITIESANIQVMLIPYAALIYVIYMDILVNMVISPFYK